MEETSFKRDEESSSNDSAQRSRDPKERLKGFLNKRQKYLEEQYLKLAAADQSTINESVLAGTSFKHSIEHDAEQF